MKEAAKMVIDLTFVILTWNSEKYLESCINSIINKCREEQIQQEIVVVDNGSTDRTLVLLERYKAQYPAIFTFIHFMKNYGTTFSRNIALNIARGDIICVLDSDTKIERGSISSIISKLRLDRQIGLIAPKLMLGDMTIQNSVKKFPSFIEKITKAVCIVINANRPTTDFYKDFPFERDTVVDNAISAGWFFRKDILRDVGYLDEKIFYSPEDLDFCRRLYNSGYITIYTPTLEITHYTQQISHRRPFSYLSISHFVGLLYYHVKHGGWLLRPTNSKQR